MEEQQEEYEAEQDRGLPVRVEEQVASAHREPAGVDASPAGAAGVTGAASPAGVAGERVGDTGPACAAGDCAGATGERAGVAGAADVVGEPPKKAARAKGDRYRFVIDACCFLFMFVNMGINSTTFNVFQPYINALPTMGDTLGSFVVGARMLSAFLVTFAAAAFYRKFDCRMGVTLACLLSAVGALVFSFSTSFPLFCLGSLFTGAAYGLGGTLAMTLVIGRWFTRGKSTALGVASMGTGFAAIIVPPVVTHLVESVSLRSGFLFESVLSALIALLVFVLLRNRPASHDAENPAAPVAPAAPVVSAAPTNPAAPANPAAPEASTSAVSAPAAPAPVAPAVSSVPVIAEPETSAPKLAPHDFLLMQIAVLFMGMASVGSNAYLSVLFTTNGFDPYFVAAMLSLSGACMMVFKPIAGRVMDVMGTRHGSALFFMCFITGQVLLCVVPCGLVLVAAAGTFFSYTGQPLSSIGVSSWALDFSTEQTRAQTIKRFQLFFTAGTFLCNLFPGALYDLCGTYVVSYIIFAVEIVLCALIVVRTYRKYGLR